MVTVDVSKLNSLISDFDAVTSQIKLNNDDISKNFYDLSKNWNDQRFAKMNSKFNNEMNSYYRLEEDVNSQLDIYRYIASRYSKIGSKIKCNLNSKGQALSKLDNIIDQLNTIIWQYDNLGDISKCPLKEKIFDQRDKLKECLDSFKEIRSSINNKYKYIDETEENISNQSDSLEIEYIVPNNYESED